MAPLIEQHYLNGRYRVDAVIGQGAYSVVYRGTHLDSRQLRAVKVVPVELPGVTPAVMQEYRTHFTAGAQYGIRIDDAHVIPAYEFGLDGGNLVLVMACATSGNLADRLWNLRLNRRLMPVDDCARVALDIADGLATVHSQDVVFRDLKPANVLFEHDGTARLADLGLAQLPGGLNMLSQVSQSGLLHPGTPAYMSPEQRHSTDYLTPPSDVYALGLLLFEMLTGRVYRNVRPGTRPLLLRTALPIWLDDLVVRMLAERPEDRPFDGFEAANLLRHRQSEDSAPLLEPSLAWEPVEPSAFDLSHAAQANSSPPLQKVRLPHPNPAEEPEPPLGWTPLE